MTAVAVDQPRVEARSRFSEVWRIVKLHLAAPSVFIGVPWLILGSAWAISLIITIIIRGANPGVTVEDLEGMRYSWAVLSPQWYLVAVGVQAVGLTLNFALGFGATRRDFWLGTSLLFAMVAAFNAFAIAALVQIEQATGGWWLGAHMFDALWYGIDGPLVDWYTSFALQLAVLFVGAAITTVFMRWRMKGTMTVLFSFIVLLLGGLAYLSFTQSWVPFATWLGSIGLIGGFTIVLVLALLSAVLGYFVIRRATPR